jgi:hypothetical protein
MRKTLTATALVLALSCPAWAGIIHTPGSPQPDPTPTPASTTQETTTINEDTTGATNSLTQIMLTLLASVLS